MNSPITQESDPNLFSHLEAICATEKTSIINYNGFRLRRLQDNQVIKFVVLGGTSTFYEKTTIQQPSPPQPVATTRKRVKSAPPTVEDAPASGNAEDSED
ncbi:MAG: hypothetical protein HC892_00290 [Saprospiraceae bacterium]|nr:hypothetical protein [Saprospiraceae bacterium]